MAILFDCFGNASTLLPARLQEWLQEAFSIPSGPINPKTLSANCRTVGGGRRRGGEGSKAQSLCMTCASSGLFLSSESQNLPKQPPLLLALGQASECLRLMARVGLGSCSFARVDDYLH